MTMFLHCRGGGIEEEHGIPAITAHAHGMMGSPARARHALGREARSASRQRLSPHATPGALCCTALAGAVRLCGAAAAPRRRARHQGRCAAASPAPSAHGPARRRPPRVWLDCQRLFSPQLGWVPFCVSHVLPMPPTDMDLCCLLHSPRLTPSDLVTACADLLQRGPSLSATPPPC